MRKYYSKNNIKKINWRLTEKETFWYDKKTDKLFVKFYNYKWLDIGMFAKYKRTMICPDIKRYKELREKRGY